MLIDILYHAITELKERLLVIDDTILSIEAVHQGGKKRKPRAPLTMEQREAVRQRMLEQWRKKKEIGPA